MGSFPVFYITVGDMTALTVNNLVTILRGDFAAFFHLSPAQQIPLAPSHPLILSPCCDTIGDSIVTMCTIKTYCHKMHTLPLAECTLCRVFPWYHGNFSVLNTFHVHRVTTRPVLEVNFCRPVTLLQ